MAVSVADAVKSAAAGGQADAVLVIGGDCTVEVGVVSGFTRPSERVGLIYLDAGPDLNVPSAVRLGFLDWMVTAHLLGLPEATQPLSHIGPRFPLLDADQIVFVGAVPDELTDWEKHTVAASALQMIWVDEANHARARSAAIRQRGARHPPRRWLLLAQTHHALHILGSRLLRFTQALFDDSGDLEGGRDPEENPRLSRALATFRRERPVRSVIFEKGQHIWRIS